MKRRIDNKEMVLCCAICTRPLNEAGTKCVVCLDKNPNSYWRPLDIVESEEKTAEEFQRLFEGPHAMRPAPNR